MARKRNPKPTENPTDTLAELPRDMQELTEAEAEATKGGSVAYASAASMGVIGPVESPVDPNDSLRRLPGFELLEPEVRLPNGGPSSPPK
jgi:hypothetical protein